MIPTYTLPAVITLALFVWALGTPPRCSGSFFPDPMPFVRFIVAVFGTLSVWLIWALILLLIV